MSFFEHVFSNLSALACAINPSNLHRLGERERKGICKEEGEGGVERGPRKGRGMEGRREGREKCVEGCVNESGRREEAEKVGGMKGGKGRWKE